MEAPYVLRHAEAVGFNGEWRVFLTCGHATPARDEQEARRMSIVNAPVRCFRCVTEMGPRKPIDEPRGRKNALAVDSP